MAEPANAGVAAFSPTAPCGGQLHGSMPAPVLPRRQPRSRSVTSRLAAARVPTKREKRAEWRLAIRGEQSSVGRGWQAHSEP
ncbi:hypothetical protein XarbCFBP8130_04570 [Xanthomonas arboricola]|nr:hypothetical protein XarbCFBP8130_04570 [Xanthomonas arboricola]